MGLLLEVKSLSIVSELVMSMSDCLIARHNLKVVLTEQGNVTVQALKEAINGSLEVLKVLVHKAKVKIECCNVWVVLTCGNLKDVKGTVHMFESS